MPTLGGEVAFDDTYVGNPLVNAMCVGVLRADDVMRAKAEGVGNVLLVVGARTGRDGIHGASFASEELTAESEARRPQVQVGDPFTEKLLLEVSLELIESRIIVAIQDMGAAGLTSSSAEMAARGGVGVDLDTARVPTRVPGMTPYEILLSESQERMLVVAEPDRVADVQAVCRKWELTATPIGSVTDDGVYRVRHGDVVVAAIPGDRLISDCPVYQPDAREDPTAAVRRATQPASDPRVDVERALEVLLDCPTIASKQWVYEQYDSTVRANTRLAPLALTVDCNARLVALDPYEGAKAAVAEAARNIACTGAVPIGITDCLNFGNPERPDVFFQFQEACRGIGDACRAFDTGPSTRPSPEGMFHFIMKALWGRSIPRRPSAWLDCSSAYVTQLGATFALPATASSSWVRPRVRPSAWLDCSSAYMTQLGATFALPATASSSWVRPRVTWAVRPTGQRCMPSWGAGPRWWISMPNVRSSSCSSPLPGTCWSPPPMIAPTAGSQSRSRVDLTPLAEGMSIEQILYGENGARAVVSCPAANEAKVLRLASDHGVLATPVGTVEDPGQRLVICVEEAALSWDVTRLRSLYFDALPGRMGLAGRDSRQDA